MADDPTTDPTTTDDLTPGALFVVDDCDDGNPSPPCAFVADDGAIVALDDAGTARPAVVE